MSEADPYNLLPIEFDLSVIDEQDQKYMAALQDVYKNIPPRPATATYPTKCDMQDITLNIVIHSGITIAVNEVATLKKATLHVNSPIKLKFEVGQLKQCQLCQNDTEYRTLCSFGHPFCPNCHYVCTERIKAIDDYRNATLNNIIVKSVRHLDIVVNEIASLSAYLDREQCAMRDLLSFCMLCKKRCDQIYVVHDEVTKLELYKHLFDISNNSSAQSIKDLLTRSLHDHKELNHLPPTLRFINAK